MSAVTVAGSVGSELGKPATNEAPEVVKRVLLMQEFAAESSISSETSPVIAKFQPLYSTDQD